MNPVHMLIQENIGSVFTAAAVEVRQRGATIYRAAFGTLDSEGDVEKGPPALTTSFFDLASLTKLFVTTAFFRLVDAGHVRLDTPLSSILPEFSGLRPIQPYEHPLHAGELVNVVPPTQEQVDASKVTFWHLLTHSSGLPAWIDLRKADSAEARIETCLRTPFSYPTGTRAAYSDVGLILLGKALEKLTDSPLDALIKRLVQKPLDLTVRYGPIPVGTVVPTEFCQWRQRRIVGEVHDENSATLGGIAGHAGLFGTAADVAELAQIYLKQGSGFVSQRLAQDSTRLQIGDRGIGWMMRTEGSSSGKYFSENSFGHTGFVGNSVWVDPQRELVAVLMTNYVFFGRHLERILNFRRNFHDTLIEWLEK